ncbi:hypothetical protein [Planctobacterium marinum]|uniref:Uncharacterized protein n=1 Tax=Planctobacterium marinum TaxID=1631968 RepID=A0AA48HX54_9ALTE|nr:hypothetical protein MACH26_17410 [Planctobacterium marinum]
MSGNSLPAQLQKVLQSHLAQKDIAYDDELQGIINRLSALNESVEEVKSKILENRKAKQTTS